MARLSALVVAGNGTNCERETACACTLGGFARVAIVPIWELVAGSVRLGDFQLLCLPGGFMDGDDLGAARAAAVRWRHARLPDGRALWEELRQFVDRDGLVIGICNGFQLLVKLGLLPLLRPGHPQQQATLTYNDSGRFEDRWVTLGAESRSPCIFTRGLEKIELPVRHGEGKLVAPPDLFSEIEQRHLVPLRYLHPESEKPTCEYPYNPNGSPGGAAALCDPSGRIFGMMPHPECFLHRTHHPRWTREQLPEGGQGVLFFRNAAAYLESA